MALVHHLFVLSAQIPLRESIEEEAGVNVMGTKSITKNGNRVIAVGFCFLRYREV